MLQALEVSLASTSSSSSSSSVLSAELSDPSQALPLPGDDSDHPLKAPMLGVIIVEFLGG